MTAGRKRAVLQYIVPTENADRLGQMIPTPVVQSIHRGEVRAPRGTEATVALQVTAFVTVIIETRYPGYSFEVDGQLVDITDPSHVSIYNIVSSTDPDGRRRRLVTYATQVASAPSSDASNL
jgi:head-tail adaptor